MTPPATPGTPAGGAAEGPLSPEEQEVARKAREAAAKRESERRSETADVAKFLSDILAPAPIEPRKDQTEALGPSLDVLLPADEHGQGGESVPEPAPEVAAPDAGPGLEALIADFESAEATREAPPPPRGAAGKTAPRAGEPLFLSAPLAEALERFREAGRFKGGIGFEAEESASAFDRTLATLSGLRKRPAPALGFEPEEAVDRSKLQAARETAILSASRAPASAPQPPGRPSLSREYSLEDLPSLGAAASAQPPSAEGAALPTGEPAMEEADLDAAGLSAALAAAESAAHQGESLPQPPGPPPPAPAVPDRPRAYTLDDLPQVPQPAPAAPGEAGAPSDEAAAPDDRLSEHRLPDLSDLATVRPVRPAESGAEPPPAGPPPASTLERAIDRSAEPGRSAAEAPSPPIPAAEDAAQLSAKELAAVERYLERETEAYERGETAAARSEPPRTRWLERRLQGLRAGVRKIALRARMRVDRALEPYCLSSKRLLGIAGIIALAVEAALIYRYWIEPVLRASGREE